MTTAPAIAAAAATTLPDRTTPSAVPPIKFSSRGFAIDHPDAETGERLMTESLGAPDREAMHGILTQLVKASVKGRKPDKTDLAMMISMVKSIQPRDAIEAMLVAQMVSVHVIAMRSAYRLASADDIAPQDSAARALGRLVRTFPAQVEALMRYRNNGEPAITVKNLSVQDGGRAIVGNVTQHARVIVSEASAPPGLTHAGHIPMSVAREREHATADAGRDDHA